MKISSLRSISVLPFLAFTFSLGVGCSGSSAGQKGGVVGFSTGDPKPDALPSDGLAPNAPTISSATAASATIQPGHPLHVTISFSDPQNDVAHLNFGIVGETGHYELALPAANSVTVDLYPGNPVPGSYILAVSLTDATGNTSTAATGRWNRSTPSLRAGPEPAVVFSASSASRILERPSPSGPSG